MQKIWKLQSTHIHTPACTLVRSLIHTGTMITELSNFRFYLYLNWIRFSVFLIDKVAGGDRERRGLMGEGARGVLSKRLIFQRFGPKHKYIFLQQNAGQSRDFVPIARLNAAAEPKPRKSRTVQTVRAWRMAAEDWTKDKMREQRNEKSVRSRRLGRFFFEARNFVNANRFVMLEVQNNFYLVILMDFVLVQLN